MTHFESKPEREKTFPINIEKRVSEIIDIPASNERPDVTYKKIVES